MAQVNGLRIILITIGISKIVEAIIASNHTVVGIIESGAKKNDITFKKFILQLILNVKRSVMGLKRFSKKNNIPYYYMKNGCDQNLENWVKSLNPDLIIVCGMKQLLKKNIYDIPKFKTFNLHPSLLPAYRGPNPGFWMYYNMELNPGVTLHFIDEGEDTGDIICQETFSIPLGCKYDNWERRAIEEVGVKLILRTLDEFEQGKITRFKQPTESPTSKARNIVSKDHNTLIDWRNWPIERIWHVLNGTESWLNAIEQPIGTFRGQRWTILKYKKCQMGGYELSKIYKDKYGPFVACREGKIYLSKKFSIRQLLLSLLR